MEKLRTLVMYLDGKATALHVSGPGFDSQHPCDLVLFAKISQDLTICYEVLIGYIAHL